MQLYINGRFLSQRVTGVQRFACETLQAMDAELEAGAYDLAPPALLTPPDTALPPLRHIEARAVGRLSGHAWEQLELPLHTRDGLLIGFAATGPLLKRNQLVTMHDASVFAVPNAFSPRFRNAYRALMVSLARVTPRTMTVSEFSKRELARHLKLPQGRFDVCGEGHEHALETPADLRVLYSHGLEPEGYVLAVGSNSAHKNFDIIPRALARLRTKKLRVVVAGGGDHRVFGATDRGHAELLRVGYVTDGQLRALYENAAAFIFPSRYEGFGLPPVEAMALGCPVISSNAASMPEVLGDAALYFAPDDADALASHMTTLHSSPEPRAALREKARAVLQRHRWRHTARAYLNTVQRMA